MPRDDFSPKTKMKLAQRAGFECSFPGCNKRTIAPSQESNESTTNIGVAAHICAAAPGGKRYVESQTPEERSSIDNGIWLCETHAKLIDTDEVRFSKKILKEMKIAHEEYISLLMSGADVKSGIFTKFKAKGIRYFPEDEFFFQNKNVFFDRLDGCSKFFDVISDTHKCLYSPKGQLNHISKISYTFHKEKKFEFIYKKNRSEINQILNKITKPFVRNPFKSVHISRPIYGIEPEIDSKNFFSRLFKLSIDELKSICNYINFEDSMIISEIDSSNDILFKIKGRSDKYHYNVFSSGEQKLIYLDFCFHLTKTLSEFIPVIVFLNMTKFSSLDENNTKSVFDTFLGKSKFQIFISCNEWQYEMINSSDYNCKKFLINSDKTEDDYDKNYG